jgi:hypothetical protein
MKWVAEMSRGGRWLGEKRSTKVASVAWKGIVPGAGAGPTALGCRTFPAYWDEFTGALLGYQVRFVTRPRTQFPIAPSAPAISRRDEDSLRDDHVPVLSFRAHGHWAGMALRLQYANQRRMLCSRSPDIPAVQAR